TAHEAREEIYDYAGDLRTISDDHIAARGRTADYSRIASGSPNVFVTGVTGFLGAFIVAALFKKFPNAQLYCLVRAASAEAGFARIKSNCERHLVWNDEWSSQLHAVAGDLGADRFGCDEALWEQLCTSLDLIVHNGALVHWIYPYDKLRGPNVIGTLTALQLATEKRLVPIHFVSSTSVLDTDYYVDKLVTGQSVYESDDLQGSKTGLRSGYGQTKWVAEQLVFRARARGVPATIIRPGYIVGDSTTGVTNTDDFIWRLVKGCIQLGQAPRISNVVNMCSVDYVADCVVQVAASPKSLDRGVFHTWNPHGFKFDDLFASIIAAYGVSPIEYIQWRTSLLELTLATADHALFPLLHFVLDDLPTSTKSPELDDANTRAILQEAGAPACPKMDQLLPLYLGYLAHVGFIETPTLATLPTLPAWSRLGRDTLVARSGMISSVPVVSVSLDERIKLFESRKLSDRSTDQQMGSHASPSGSSQGETSAKAEVAKAVFYDQFIANNSTEPESILSSIRKMPWSRQEAPETRTVPAFNPAQVQKDIVRSSNSAQGSIGALREKLIHMMLFAQGEDDAPEVKVDVSNEPAQFRKLKSLHHKLNMVLEEYDLLTDSMRYLEVQEKLHVYEVEAQKSLQTEIKKLKQKYNDALAHNDVEEERNRVYVLERDCATLTKELAAMEKHKARLEEELRQERLRASNQSKEIDLLAKKATKRKLQTRLLRQTLQQQHSLFLQEEESTSEDDEESVANADLVSVSTCRSRPKWNSAPRTDLLSQKPPSSVFSPNSDDDSKSVASSRKSRISTRIGTVSQPSAASEHCRHALMELVRHMDQGSVTRLMAQHTISALLSFQKTLSGTGTAKRAVGVDQQEAERTASEFASPSYRGKEVARSSRPAVKVPDSFFITQRPPKASGHETIPAKPKLSKAKAKPPMPAPGKDELIGGIQGIKLGH
ncbi:large subunit of alpha-aminoadipate reductase, partial [Kappamyces sp. JEL0680]